MGCTCTACTPLLIGSCLNVSPVLIQSSFMEASLKMLTQCFFVMYVLTQTSYKMLARRPKKSSLRLPAQVIILVQGYMICRDTWCRAGTFTPIFLGIQHCNCHTSNNFSTTWSIVFVAGNIRLIPLHISSLPRRLWNRFPGRPICVSSTKEKHHC